ncbi:permease prefix domain 1-containing protein [Gracilibacillus sp. S3-1-1]|uniref:Permease prefix domain 1-containing protein n=1 Tax=Gracilibacillus pellucidus TaxID=3095368 RepID=A0ACC6M5W3_9BACI|nr:permease prefix domain 1-containing protein [Gracilibacillus sp. S3-1-1]MDX8046286.1 permease prefix domain 1-containing protein [Gracilibacillus sp. S3-1-1]
MKIEQYVNKVISYIELNEENKKDLKKELIGHLSDKTSYYEQQGKDKESAVKQSIKDFGNAKEIGAELNEAFFPYRKQSLLLLSLLTVLFAFSLSITLFIYQDHFPLLWFILTVTSTIPICIFIYQPARSANNRLMLITLLLFLNILYFFSLFLMDGVMTNVYLYIILIILVLSCFVISITQIYLGAFYQPVSRKLTILSVQKRKAIIITNIITGIIVCGVSLLLIMGFLIFAPSVMIIFPIITIVLWLISIIGELKSEKLENMFRILKILLALLALGFITIPQFLL